MGKRICLTGFSEMNRRWAGEQPDDVEIWGLNEGHNCTTKLVMQDDLGRTRERHCWCFNPNACRCKKHDHTFIPRYERWFQIHPPEWNQQKWIDKAAQNGDRIDEKDLNAFGRNEKHVKFLQECDKPLYMLHLDNKWGPFPSALQYPLEEVEESLGTPWAGKKHIYATSSPAYMLALALHEHLQGDTIDEVRYAGIELSIGTEYFFQRPCMEFYLGMAMGMGIEVTRPPMGSSLLSAPRYAIDAAPVGPKGIVVDPTPIKVPDGDILQSLIQPDIEYAERQEETVAR